MVDIFRVWTHWWIYSEFGHIGGYIQSLGTWVDIFRVWTHWWIYSEVGHIGGYIQSFDTLMLFNLPIPL